MLRRILAFALAFAVAVCALSSCDLLGGKDAATIIAEAENQLALTDHTVNISMTFTSSDEDMRNALAALDNSKITLTQNGEFSQIDLELTFGEDYFKDSYVIAEGVIYHTTSSTIDGVSDGIKEKATLTETEKENAINNAGAGMILSYDDFDSVVVESSSNVNLITCKQIKSDSLDSLVDIFKSNFDLEATEVDVSNVELVIRTVDGLYNGVYLACDYSVTVDGTTYDVRMQSVREYDVTTPVFIGTPLDADDYIETTYTEMTK